MCRVLPVFDSSSLPNRWVLCLLSVRELIIKRELYTMDKARKSFGILTNAVMLEYKEFLSHIAWVKLGAMLGMINITEVDQIDNLIVSVRPANL